MKKSTWRRIATGTIALGAMVALVACSGRGGGGSEAATEVDFPTKDITLVVPYSSGGNTDTAARALAPELESDLGVSVIVQNREGASGTLGMEYVGQQAADGYTVGLMTIDSALWAYQGYDLSPFDWDHLAQVSATPTAIAVGPDSEYSTLQALVNAAKAAPDTITLGLGGTGTNPESVVRELEALTGATFRLVPFDGGAPTVTAVMGGQVDAVVAGTGELSGPHSEGLLTTISVLTEDENPALPGVATAASEGIELYNSGWSIAVVPKGTPDAVKEQLRAAIETGVASESYGEATKALGNVPKYLSGTELEEFVQSELDRLETVFGQ